MWGNTETDLQEAEWEGVERIHMVDFRAIISFRRRALLNGVN
jgi:hypothetical protein